MKSSRRTNGCTSGLKNWNDRYQAHVVWRHKLQRKSPHGVGGVRASPRQQASSGIGTCAVLGVKSVVCHRAHAWCCSYRRLNERGERTAARDDQNGPGLVPVAGAQPSTQPGAAGPGRANPPGRNADPALPLKAIATNLFPLPSSQLPSPPTAQASSSPTGESAPPMATAKSFGGRRYVRRKQRVAERAPPNSAGDSKHDAPMEGPMPRIRPTTPTRDGSLGRRRMHRSGRLGSTLDRESKGGDGSLANSRRSEGSLVHNTSRGSTPGLETDGERKTTRDMAGSSDSLELDSSMGSLSPIPSAASPSFGAVPGFRSRRLRHVRASTTQAGDQDHKCGGDDSQPLPAAAETVGSGGGKEDEPVTTHHRPVRARARSLLRQRLDERLALPDGSPVPKGGAKGGGITGEGPRRSNIITGAAHAGRIGSSDGRAHEEAAATRVVSSVGGNQLYRGALRNLFPDGPDSTGRVSEGDSSMLDVASPAPTLGGTGRSGESGLTDRDRTPASLRSLADLMFSPSMRPTTLSPSMRKGVPQAPTKRTGDAGPAAQASLMAATGTLVFN